MDAGLAAQFSSEVSEPQPAFRKPSNDTSRRNYRRHSPSTSRSSSPPSTGAWKRDRSPSSFNSQDDGGFKAVDSVKKGRRFERGREVDREAESIRDLRADLGYSDSRSKKHYSSKYDDHIHVRYSSYYDRKGSHSDSRFRQDDYWRFSRVECRSPSRNYREKGYDDRRRSGRIDDWNSEWSYRERGNEKNRDGGKFWNDRDRGRDRDGESQRDKNNEKDKYRDSDLCLERGKAGSRCPDVDLDADPGISKDSAVGRENVRDRSKHTEKDERSKCREKDDRHRYNEQSKGRGKDCSHKNEEDRHTDTDEVKECGWKKELDRQIVKESLKEPACPKEREDTNEKDMGSDEEYEQEQNYSHHYDTVMDRRKSDMGRERQHKHSRDKNQSDGGSGQDDISSKEKCQNEVLVHEKERPSLGSSEGTDKAENCTLNRECKCLGFLTSDINLRTEDAATGTSVGGKLHANDLDLTQGQAKHSPGTSDGNSGKSSKWGPEARPSSELVTSTASEAEVASDLNAATLAAMRAAELVNKNLGTGVFSSADQKKKLLWGTKKNSAAQEAAAGTNRWSTAHFPDRDRQEKFNKLMSLSAPCYQWRFVGCERRFLCGPRQRERVWACSTEAKGATARSREAVYCRYEASRWSDSGPWIITGSNFFKNLRNTGVLDVLSWRASEKHWIFSSSLQEVGSEILFNIVFVCEIRAWYVYGAEGEKCILLSSAVSICMHFCFCFVSLRFLMPSFRCQMLIVFELFGSYLSFLLYSLLASFSNKFSMNLGGCRRVGEPGT